MVKKYNDFDPQLESAVLTDKAKLSLYKKSVKSGISANILEEVYQRGINTWNPTFGYTAEQFGFDRVNSFISGGFASQLDEDLLEEKRGLWDNIHAKRARIKAGSGERMRKPGSKGAPTDAAIRASQNEDADPCWTGYKQIGMKMKKGKKVPNCVPVKEMNISGMPSYTNIENKRLPFPNKTETNLNKNGNGKPVDISKLSLPDSKLSATSIPTVGGATPFSVGNGTTPKGHYKPTSTFPDGDGKSVTPKNKMQEDAEKHSKNSDEPASRFIGSNELVDIYKKQTPGQIIKKVVRERLEEAAMQAAQAPAPTAADMSPTKLGRNARVELSRRAPAGGEGLRNVGANRYSGTSPTNLSSRSVRSATATPTSRLAPSSGPSLKPTSVNAPKTAASAPTSAPKPTASFGSSSRPTTVSATSGGVGKSGGYNLSSGMSDAGKAKVKPTAPVQIPAGAGKVASALGKVAKFAGPVGAVAGLVADAKPLNKGEDELGRQKSLGISKPNVTPGMGSTKNIEPVKGGAITTKAPDYYKGKVGDYTVKSGDTLSGIAQRTGQSVADLATKNKFDSENKIAAGSKIFTGDVPTPPKRPEETESGVRKKIRECIEEATYKGKKVPLNKPMKGDVKKSKVFVDPDGDGKAQKVNFGDKSLSIKKHIPARKKSYCARSGGQGNLTDKTSANYWSRRAWNCEETEVNETFGLPHYMQKLKRDEPLSITKRNDPLEQRKGKESTRNQYQREFPADYAKKKIAKGNLTPKDEIKAILGKHTKPNLPEHAEVNELSVPAGTTGKRKEVSTPLVAVRMASGKIEKHPPGKSGSSGGGDE